MEGLDRDLAGILAESEPLVAEQTGFAPPGTAHARVMTRPEWASANIPSMMALMSPLLARAEERMGKGPAAGVMRFGYGPALGAQLGVVLGFLSHRVLGQYDALTATAGEVWFVGANVVLTEKRMGFLPRDFRMWVAVHELTHRAQFEANPWIKEHFLSLVSELFSSLDLDARTWLQRMKVAVGEPGDDTPLGVRILSEDQRRLFDRLQAFMSLIEGHASWVMDEVGSVHIPTQPWMRRALKRAAPSGPVARMIQRLLGMDLKKLQYEEGQRFCEAVAREGGREAVARSFASPESLPELAEIRDPQAWLARL